MCESERVILVLSRDSGLFEALRARASDFTMMRIDSSREAISLARDRRVQLALIELRLTEMAVAELIRRESSQCKVLFFSRFGNAPFFRQRLDELGFESSGVVPTQFLFKYVTEIIDSLTLDPLPHYTSAHQILEAKASHFPVDVVGLVKHLHSRPQLGEALSWSALEILLEDFIDPFGCKIDLARRTKDGGKDILAIVRPSPSQERRYLLQAKRANGRVILGAVQEVRFFHAYGMRVCLATTCGFTGEYWQHSLESRWQLDVWDYEELKNWILRQGWWAT